MILPNANLRLGSWDLDGWVLALSGVLLALGLTMLTSASITVADRDLGEPFYFLIQQLQALGIGVVLLLVALQIPLRFWEMLSFALVGLALLLLIAVLVPGLGNTVNGATRWLNLGPFSFQPSDPARLLLIMYLAGYMVRQQEAIRGGLVALLRPMLFVGAACTLLLLQPDFGAAVVLIATTIGMLFVGGARVRYFLLFGLALAAGLAALALLAPYRVDRLIGFRDPFADPTDNTYQLLQSLIAFGRGEWFGVGLGNSVQKLFYLPEAHTDFVFAVLGEELGLFGVMLTMGLYALLVLRCMQLGMTAARQQLFYASYLAFGIGLWFGLQAFVNMAVNMGLLPTKGLPLPLMSYGRSCLLITLVAVGLLLRIHHECQQTETRSGRASRVTAARPRRVREEPA